MPYTTDQLIQILEQELHAHWRGERVLLSATQRLDNPVIARALQPERLSMVFGYQDFRAQIHEYQRQHGVSGLVWRTCRFGAGWVTVPEVHPHLVPVAGDKAILMAHKPAILDFWGHCTQGLDLWVAGSPPESLTPEGAAGRIDQAEWLEVEATTTELHLGLCWGDPRECHYGWAAPASGCERLVAAPGRPSALKM